MTIVAAYALARFFPPLEFTAPFSWLLAGRTEFAVAALIAPMTLTTPLSRLPRPETRRLVLIFLLGLTLTTLQFFLAPALNRGLLQGLKTQVDSDGVCRQSTDYNCGPAAAVTALLRLGLPAEEGELAILARTSNAAGTPPDLLAEALNRRYGADGLVAEHRLFRSIDDLPEGAVTIAIVKFGFLVDHYVTILQVTASDVHLADPLEGRVTLSREAFSERWRRTGVTVARP